MIPAFFARQVVCAALATVATIWASAPDDRPAPSPPAHGQTHRLPLHQVGLIKDKPTRLKYISLTSPDLGRAFLGLRPHQSRMNILFGLSGRAAPGQVLILQAACRGCKTKTKANHLGLWTAQLPLSLSSPYPPTEVSISYQGSHKYRLRVNILWVAKQRIKAKKSHKRHSARHRPRHPHRPDPRPVVPPTPVEPAGARAALAALFAAVRDHSIQTYCAMLANQSLPVCLADAAKGIDLGADPQALIDALSTATWDLNSQGVVYYLLGNSWQLVQVSDQWKIVR